MPQHVSTTLGEIDLHLVAEGRHEQLWQALGAHVRTTPEPGTSFKISGHTLEVVQTQERIVKSVRIYP